MENSTFNIFLSEGAGIELDTDLNRVSLDQCDIMIWDVERPAVREGDAERPERDFVHALAQLHRGNHDLILARFNLCFKQDKSEFQPLAFSL
jgi:hypothetical protein